MPNFNSIINRSDVGEALMPEQAVSEIIQETARSSVLLDRARQVRMSAKKMKQPVLATLPEAYWVTGDTGQKQTSKTQWSDVSSAENICTSPSCLPRASSISCILSSLRKAPVFRIYSIAIPFSFASLSAFSLMPSVMSLSTSWKSNILYS